MSIYSNDNIIKIAKLTTRELPQKSKNAKITVRENNGLYSSPDIWFSWNEAREINFLSNSIYWSFDVIILHLVTFLEAFTKEID